MVMGSLFVTVVVDYNTVILSRLILLWVVVRLVICPCGYRANN
jgi:hypothetical protein